MTVNLCVLTSAPMEKMDYTSPCLFEYRQRASVCAWHDRARTASFILTRQAEAEWANASFIDASCVCKCFVCEGITLSMITFNNPLKPRLHEQSSHLATSPFNPPHSALYRSNKLKQRDTMRLQTVPK